jgi:hypothetical protein
METGRALKQTPEERRVLVANTNPISSIGIVVRSRRRRASRMRNCCI